ncbi:MAG TPA: hypothetical protein VFA21_21070 [Pyrinomonadaceae bacterium]|nr:hypothetical protein [Pyrinomonadaceae bacterium]
MSYLTPAEADPLLLLPPVSNLHGAAAAQANSRAAFLREDARREVG